MIPVRNIPRLIWSDAVEYTRSVVRYEYNKAHHRWDWAEVRADEARMYAERVIGLAGQEFGEALLTYCREEALLLHKHPEYAPTVGHWVTGFRFGGFDRAKWEDR